VPGTFRRGAHLPEGGTLRRGLAPSGRPPSGWHLPEGAPSGRPPSGWHLPEGHLPEGHLPEAPAREYLGAVCEVSRGRRAGQGARTVPRLAFVVLIRSATSSGPTKEAQRSAGMPSRASPSWMIRQSQRPSRQLAGQVPSRHFPSANGWAQTGRLPLPGGRSAAVAQLTTRDRNRNQQRLMVRRLLISAEACPRASMKTTSRPRPRAGWS
jgi:hypothetical protein